MPRQPLIAIRVPETTRASWDAAAAAAGMSLSAFVRDTVDAAIEDQAVEDARMSPRKGRAQVEKKAPRAAVKKTQACERERFHRPGTFCKTCKRSW